MRTTSVMTMFAASTSANLFNSHTTHRRLGHAETQKLRLLAFRMTSLPELCQVCTCWQVARNCTEGREEIRFHANCLRHFRDSWSVCGQIPPAEKNSCFREAHWSHFGLWTLSRRAASGAARGGERRSEGSTLPSGFGCGCRPSTQRSLEWLSV